MEKINSLLHLVSTNQFLGMVSFHTCVLLVNKLVKQRLVYVGIDVNVVCELI